MESEKPPVPRVSSVSIARLYNLGNFEHLKYEIRIEIPEGANVLESVSKLRQVLRALKPIPAEDYTKKKARQIVAWSDEEKEKAYVENRVSREDIAAAQGIVDKLDARKAKREAALRLFSDLGGELVYMDHKEQWDDNDDYCD